MNKFWQWMLSKEYCIRDGEEIYFYDSAYDMKYFNNKIGLIGYMIQYLMEETDTKNIEIVKDNFSIDSMYELIVKAIEEKNK